jgi:hypothetical protein
MYYACLPINVLVFRTYVCMIRKIHEGFNQTTLSGVEE